MASFKGGTDTTETKNYTANPLTASFASNVSGQAGNLPGAGAVPLQGVQGFSPDQIQAFQQARNAQGIASPYLASAQQFIQQGGQAIDPSQVAALYKQLSDPVFASQNNLFGQQRSQNTGNVTQAAGGVGADRIGVAQANLAGQQGLAQGQTGSGLMQNAINTYMQQRQQQQSAGTLMGQLGGQAQQAAATDFGNLYGMGAQQQGLGQAGLNAQFAQAQGQYQNPYMNLQAGQGTLGALSGALGGNTTTTTQRPEQGWGGTAIGLGMAGVGAAMGNPGMMASGAGMASGKGSQAATGAGNLFGGGAYGTGSLFGGGQLASGPPAPGGYYPRTATGGRVDPYAILERFNQGGKTIDLDRSEWAHKEGGGELSFDDRFAPVPEALNSGEFGTSPGIPPLPQSPWHDPALHLPSPPRLPKGLMSDGNQGDPEGVDTVSYGPQSARGEFGPKTSEEIPAAALPAGPARMPPSIGGEQSPGGLPPLPSTPPGPDQSSRLAQNPWMALMQAGLGTMAAAGKRDQFGIPTPVFAAVGEGGMKGVKMLEEQQKANLAERQHERQVAQMLEAARMARVPYTMETANQRRAHAVQQAQVQHLQESDKLARERFEKPYDELTAEQKEQIDLKRRESEKGRWEYLGPSKGKPGHSVFLDKHSPADDPSIKEVPFGIDPKNAPKPIPEAFKKRVDPAVKKYQTSAELYGRFSDQFAGNQIPYVGEIKNWIGRNLKSSDPAKVEAAKWWQAYEAYKADIRHGLYGAALTKYEIDQWNKQDITPAMRPDVLRENIGRQNKIIQNALRREGKTLIKDKYDKDAVESYLGIPMDETSGGDENQQALDWIKANPNDPRVPAMKKKLGIP